ncbi:MAG: UDP-N-acetylmuramoyl-L-alanine--D-glutamate ligase [Thiohalomonadaceae bacterium]
MTLIVGLGKTGLSVARFLARRGERFAMADSRANPPGLEQLRAERPAVEVHLGPFDTELFCRQTRIIVSPGVSLQEPALQAARAAGVEMFGDIELFARSVDAPVVGITGSNGKSTVTTLVGAMAKAAGLETRVGGNLGTPALELLLESDEAGAPDLYVLELSSFQLETVTTLNCRVATVLNLSADHLDRHGGMEEYAALKQRIFCGDGVMVLNADDGRVSAMAEKGREVRWFTLGAPHDEASYGVRWIDGRTSLCCGAEAIIAVEELKIAGRHNWANALAALALGDAMAFPRAAMLRALREFTGLPHRCQWVAEVGGVNWYDDSKGTNVGSTLAALSGMPGNKVVLIAGGDGKGQDFAPLRDTVATHARAVVLIGRDAPLIEQALNGVVPVVNAGRSLEQAVHECARLAQPGDSVLLSPACASFDMFDNYVHRAEVFVAAVRGLTA